jgi:hypothetical protein
MTAGLAGSRAKQVLDICGCLLDVLGRHLLEAGCLCRGTCAPPREPQSPCSSATMPPGRPPQSPPPAHPAPHSPLLTPLARVPYSRSACNLPRLALRQQPAQAVKLGHLQRFFEREARQNRGYGARESVLPEPGGPDISMLWASAQSRR